jgi:hypothetical protein
MTRRLWLPALFGALVFGLTLGARQSQALFIGPINTATGLGIGAISLAFGVGQLMWGVAQPIAGALADRHGAGRVIACGALLVALGSALTPFAQSQLALVFAIGILAALGAGAAGPSVLMSAVGRMTPLEKRGFASGIVNAGGSMGQFVIVPLAAAGPPTGFLLASREKGSPALQPHRLVQQVLPVGGQRSRAELSRAVAHLEADEIAVRRNPFELERPEAVQQLPHAAHVEIVAFLHESIVIERGGGGGERQAVDVERLAHAVHQIGQLALGNAVADTQPG